MKRKILVVVVVLVLAIAAWIAWNAVFEMGNMKTSFGFTDAILWRS